MKGVGRWLVLAVLATLGLQLYFVLHIAALAVVINASVLSLLFRRELTARGLGREAGTEEGGRQEARCFARACRLRRGSDKERDCRIPATSLTRSMMSEKYYKAKPCRRFNICIRPN